MFIIHLIFLIYFCNESTLDMALKPYASLRTMISNFPMHSQSRCLNHTRHHTHAMQKLSSQFIQCFALAKKVKFKTNNQTILWQSSEDVWKKLLSMPIVKSSYCSSNNIEQQDVILKLCNQRTNQCLAIVFQSKHKQSHQIEVT